MVYINYSINIFVFTKKEEKRVFYKTFCCLEKYDVVYKLSLSLIFKYCEFFECF